MMIVQKPEKPDFGEDITSEMAQHKADIHTALTKEDKEEMKIQKEVSDIDFWRY